jgi:cell division protein FtsA
MIPAGIVLTGGGSQMEGLTELAESIFQMPIRIGLPQHVKGLAEVLDNPSYATSVGLLLYGYQQQYDGRPELVSRPGVKGVFGKMRNWFQGNF